MGAATATTLFAFGPGINGYVGLERAPGAIRFGEFVDGGEKYVYTTPAPNDEASQSGASTGGGDDDDDYDSTDGQFTMDEIADFPDLPADIATWQDGVLEWVAEYALTKPTLRSAADLEAIGDMVAGWTKLTGSLGQMATDIDNTIKVINKQLTMAQQADGVKEELNKRKSQLRTATSVVGQMKIFADNEIKNKDFEMKIKGGSSSSSTIGDDGAAGGMNQGALIGVIAAIVVVLGMAGAVAFLVIKKNRGVPKQYRNHPTTQQNPAYEAPKAGAQRGAPPKQNVQQQGQRKVLVLDPYGNDA